MNSEKENNKTREKGKKGKSSFKFHDAAIIGVFHVSVDRVAVLGTSSSSVLSLFEFYPY